MIQNVIFQKENEKMSNISYVKNLEVKKDYDVIVCGGGVAVLDLLLPYSKKPMPV